ncbi:MAG: indole-3-glycerol phosphate synthase TrpC [Lentisphaerae bacterium]|nr:indole-3-glycerol phosphate synthase TrpC [Lentisphaerota bacterium]
MAERRADTAHARGRVPLNALRERAARRRHHSLAEALTGGGGTRIIAELKKASPSAGLLRRAYRPAALARAYEAAGACAVSVLTEPRHFLGRGEHLEAVRAATRLPVLRKDFIGDPYQVAEAAAWGADAVLLIVAALEGPALRRLFAEARTLGLDVLVEAHSARELELALALPGAIVGVNSRNLKTLETSLDTARSLAGRIPAERISVAESGIRTRAEIEDLEARGYRGFLIGETLLRSGRPGAAVRALRGAGDAGPVRAGQRQERAGRRANVDSGGEMGQTHVLDTNGRRAAWPN